MPEKNLHYSGMLPNSPTVKATFCRANFPGAANIGGWLEGCQEEPPQGRTNRITAEQAAETLVILHAERGSVAVGRFEIVLAQSIKARVGLKLAPNEVPFSD
ncbi:hypothetical protein [Desulfonatronum thiosulfatophilum]|uniref:hypothetical protein n=1 Tax=Desulfonatronum thiosulfatophilum TaxID=617002 RepID=UPI0013797ABB|nr:hypothetical protein [Desulfonatronum thiosulfatophilum]